MVSESPVKPHDDEMRRLGRIIMEMGGLAETQIAAAVEAMVKRDSELAAYIVETDGQIDLLEQQVSQLTVRLLALRQPMACDLREIVGALKIAGDLERIGDYAANIAKRSIALNQTRPARPVYAIPRLAKLALSLVRDVIDAYVERDAGKAVDVWMRDAELDEMHAGIFQQIIAAMVEDPRNITACTHLVFVAKNIERIGDHATNIAEALHFAITGRVLEEARPKIDRTSAAAVIAPAAATDTIAG